MEGEGEEGGQGEALPPGLEQGPGRDGGAQGNILSSPVLWIRN